MNIMTIAGTRPELIRLCRIIDKLDTFVNHTFVYTNQNYDYNLSGKFFEELKIREPDYTFDQSVGTISNFLANAFVEFEQILFCTPPDKILILGDTNSGLISIIANRCNIPVYHMEAGNRCYDRRVPEETNRRLIDHASTYNLPYTENSKQNLINEGFHKNNVFKTGNPIYEVLNYYKQEIFTSTILDKFNIKRQEFVLVTAHRAENVDNAEILEDIMDAVNKIAEQYKVIFSIHPRTRARLDSYRIKMSDNVTLSDPLGFFDFVTLEQTAKMVISDSGTVQEECCIFGVPSITIRQTTERQETIECGSNILSGTRTEDILNAFNIMNVRGNTWSPPEDYLVPNVSDVVINILLGR